MALKATVFKANLQIANIDRHYYRNHALTLARYPSEADERLMMRLLAFALHASDTLAFGEGLSADDEPDLWQKDLTGAIELWIDVGQPDEKLVRKACGHAAQVFVYSYGGRVADLWWSQAGSRLDRSDNLTVINVPAPASESMAGLAQRNMQLQFTIQDGQVWVADPHHRVEVDLRRLKEAQPWEDGTTHNSTARRFLAGDRSTQGTPAPPPLPYAVSMVERERRSGERRRVGLCVDCRYTRPIQSARGSPFYLCLRSASDRKFPKYPCLPVVACSGYEPKGASP